MTVPSAGTPAKKWVVLTFISNYLPGYKSGGILRTLANTVDQLSDEFEFWIVTRDRDLDDLNSYPGIRIKEWQPLGLAKVYYVPPADCTFKEIAKIITETRHDILYLNSFFDPVFTLKILISRRLGWHTSGKSILAPRGELLPGPLAVKKSKKNLFIFFAKLAGLYRKLSWHASSEWEAESFIKIMDVKPEAVHIALDLPDLGLWSESLNTAGRNTQQLKLVFLSRISREKNLHYALEILKRSSAELVFDIYGPKEDKQYWGECEKRINDMPSNVSVNYRGSISPDQVQEIFSQYDLFFFPTSGENYGHVIAESLLAGTPVLISDRTPWNNFVNEGCGWTVDLDKADIFVDILNSFKTSSTLQADRQEIRLKVREYLQNPIVLRANKELFKNLLPER